MTRRLATFVSRLNLMQRFTIASFVIILFGTLGIGRWIAERIKAGAVRESGISTALYMDSFIVPNVQELGESKPLTPEHIETLNNLFSNNDLGRRTVSIKIWDANQRIVYSNIPSLVGEKFPEKEDREAAWHGSVTADISDLQEAENAYERSLSNRLLEIYSPVQQNGTGHIIAVAEFYQKVDALEAEIAAAQRFSWLVVATTMAVAYLLLLRFVQNADRVIQNQKAELKSQVEQLIELLGRNDGLTQRVRRAAADAAHLNERLLQRTSAELNAGPVQEIGLALQRLERVKSQNETCRLVNPNFECTDQLPIAKKALQTALKEIGVIATGLVLPQLEVLTLPDIFAHVVNAHEQRTATQVRLELGNLPNDALLSIKIMAYRFVQEALNNAYNHAGGTAQEVHVTCEADILQIEVSDQGPGFDLTLPLEQEGHLGLAGMRERVESLGGVFRIESKINQGTKVISRLSLRSVGETIYG